MTETVSTAARPLRLAFMGTPAFAVPALAALADAGHDIAAVYTQPPRPSGRGHKTTPGPVQAWAEDRGLPVRHPATLKDPADRQAFADLDLDVAVVAAYGLILPRPVLAAPRHGCLNIHASLLPRWRGAAPIQRAILAGDGETGVTIMGMEAGLDTGPMGPIARVPIADDTRVSDLHDALAAAGAALILDALDRLAAGTLTLTPQPADGVTYAEKIAKADGVADFGAATRLDRQVRALVPWPGVTCRFGDTALKLHGGRPVGRPAGTQSAVAGTVLDDRLTVACGDGTAFRIDRLQRPGKAPADTAAVLNGFPIPAGSCLDP